MHDTSEVVPQVTLRSVPPISLSEALNIKQEVAGQAPGQRLFRKEVNFLEKSLWSAFI